MEKLKRIKKKIILLGTIIMLMIPTTTVFARNPNMMQYNTGSSCISDNGLDARGNTGFMTDRLRNSMGRWDCGHYASYAAVSDVGGVFICGHCAGYYGSCTTTYALNYTMSNICPAYYFNTTLIKRYEQNNGKTFIGFVSGGSDVTNAIPILDANGNIKGYNANLIAGTNYLLDNTYYPSGGYGIVGIAFSIPNYTIKYNANGGTYSDGKEIKYELFDTTNDSNIGKNIPTKEGYTFLGYKTKLISGEWSNYNHGSGSDWEITTSGQKPVVIEDTSKRRSYSINSNLITQAGINDLTQYKLAITEDNTTCANSEKVTVSNGKTVEQVLSEAKSGSNASIAPYGTWSQNYVWGWNAIVAGGSSIHIVGYDKEKDNIANTGYYINTLIKNGVSYNVKSVDSLGNITPISYNEPAYYSNGTTLTICEYKTILETSDESVLKCNMVNSSTRVKPLGKGKAVIELSAVWQRNIVEYKVKLDSNKPTLALNDVTGMVVTEMLNYGGNCYFWNKDNIAYPDGSYGELYFEPKLIGYTFLGWYTKNGYDENGNDLGDAAWGTKVTADTVNEGETDVIYARWADKTSPLLENSGGSSISFTSDYTKIPSDSEWNNTALEIKYYAKDSGSGLNNISISEITNGTENLLKNDTSWVIGKSKFSEREEGEFSYSSETMEGTHIYQITAYDQMGNYTKTPYIVAKTDTTLPVINTFDISQTKLTDLGYNTKTLALESEKGIGNIDGTSIKEEILGTRVTELEENMTTSIEAKVSDYDGQGNKTNSSGIEKVEILIEGNKGSITLSTKAEEEKYKLTISGSITNSEGLVEGIISWKGNLYKELNSSSTLKYTIKVTDNAGNVSESRPISNNHPSVKEGWDSDNYDAIACITRNDTLNEAFNGTYITKNDTLTALTLWEEVGNLLGNPYTSYEEFFKDQYNFMRFGEYCTITILTYGDVEIVGTNFNTNTISLEDARTELFNTYGIESLPSLSREISIDNNVNTAASLWSTLGYQYDGTSTTPEISWTTAYHNGSTGVVTYNTRFPLGSNQIITAGIKDFEVTAKKGEDGISFYVNYNLGSLNIPSSDSSSGIEIGGIEEDVHIRISTNHTNGKLEYK